MFNLKYFVKLVIAYFNRFKGIIFISVIAGLFIFFILTNLLPEYSGDRVVRIGITGRYHSEDLPGSILEMVSDGLTAVDDTDQTIKPALASRWEEADDGKTWTFFLRDDIYWQDGQKVTSADLNFNFRDVEINKDDPAKIIFSLKDAFSPFPSILTKPVFKKGLLGTGEWEVKNVTFTGGFVHELTLINKDKKTRLYRFYPTTERTATAFKLGKVDEILNVYDPKPFDSWENVTVETMVDTSQVVTLFFNVSDEILSDKSLRQALFYAVKKDGFTNRAYSPLSPESWAYNPQVKEYLYDPERARETISELPEEIREKLNIRLVTSSVLLGVAENISKDWKEVGIDSNIQVTSIIPNEFQAFLTILDIPKDPDQYYLWHTTQSATNISKYSNLRIDKLLEDGRAETDFEERRKIYLDFQRYLLEDLPAAFLFHPSYYNVYR